MHSYISIALLIILLFPFLALGHGKVPSLNVDPGTLPGERGYFFERIGEWFEVNIFTVSTKRKQEKKLEFAVERLAEILRLAETKDSKTEDLEQGLRRYQYFLRDAEDMAEKIIFLDGAELPLAEEFEKTSRVHEQVLVEFLEEAPADAQGVIQEALITARLENEDAFKFMVKNYQFTENDIEKHRKILNEHLEMVEARLGKDNPKYQEATAILIEARKYQKAGLNLEAYDLAKRAKNMVY